MEWSTIVMTKETSPEFAATFEESKLVWSGKKEKSFFPENVHNANRYGYRFERACRFWTEKALEDEMQTSLKELGVTPDRLITETGERVSGILVQSNEPPRVTLWSEGYLDQHEVIFDGNQRQVREKQGSEIAQWFMTQAGSRKGSMTLGLAAPKTHQLDVLRAKSKEIQEKKAKLEAAEQLRKVMAEQASQGVVPAVEEAPESSEEEVEVDMVGGAFLPGVIPAHRKGKAADGRGKPNSKSKRQSKEKRKKRKDDKVLTRTVLPSTLGSQLGLRAHSFGGSQLGGSASQAPSTAAGSGGSGGKSFRETMDRYARDLDPVKVMSHPDEKGSGRSRWQASQTLSCLKRKQPTGADTILLGGMVAEARKAVNLTAGVIKKVSREKRLSLVQDFMKQGIKFPPEAHAALLSMHLKEMPLETVEDVMEFLDCLLPINGDEPQPFDPMRPTLAGAQLSDTLSGQLLQAAA